MYMEVRRQLVQVRSSALGTDHQPWGRPSPPPWAMFVRHQLKQVLFMKSKMKVIKKKIKSFFFIHNNPISPSSPLAIPLPPPLPSALLFLNVMFLEKPSPAPHKTGKEKLSSEVLTALSSPSLSPRSHDRAVTPEVMTEQSPLSSLCTTVLLEDKDSVPLSPCLAFST